MRNKIELLILVSTFILGACHKSSEHDQASTEIAKPQEAPLLVAVNETSEDVKVPGQIFKMVEGDVKLATGGFSFFPMKVVLKEKNSGVLTNSEIIFELPKGGARLDLANYIGHVPGSFYLRFEFEADKSSQVSVFFVSNTKSRKLDNEKWGMGCRHYADVTKYVQSQNKGLGIKLNTTQKRHLSVIGGSFIFALNDGKHLSMSQVTFEDSKFQELFCLKKGNH